MADEQTNYQDAFPEQQQHFLHREVGGMATAELGNHGKEHHRNRLAVIQLRT